MKKLDNLKNLLNISIELVDFLKLIVKAFANSDFSLNIIDLNCSITFKISPLKYV